MRYKFLVLIIFSIVSAQSLFNRFLGADSFSGSSRSTAMGKTHLLNSTGSNNVRFNPAMLSAKGNDIGIDFQVNRFSSFERWSMPMRDSFDEVLVYGDYVSNEFSKFLVTGGATMSLKIPFIGNLGVGFRHYPLTHFTYAYSEEVRGSYRLDDGEYSSKDPIVGYHNYNVDGTIMTSTVGVGANLNLIGDLSSSIGFSISSTQPFKITHEIIVDSLYSDVTNLSEYTDAMMVFETAASEIFFGVNFQLDISTRNSISILFEDKFSINFTENNLDFSIGVDSTLYIKPQLISLSWIQSSTELTPLAFAFQVDQLSYIDDGDIDDFYKWKFGFEYMTQLGTPVRGGLVYTSERDKAFFPSTTMFTFGSGKNIGDISIDISGTYELFTFQHVDLFPVENDVRPNVYDTIRDSQLNLFLAVSYSF
jgi:hypothetical protein